MNQTGELDRSRTERLAQELHALIGSCWKTQVVYVAAELRIADVLSDHPRTIEELAAITQSNHAALRQLLRALTTLDICSERADGSFELAPLGTLLVSDAPDSLHAWTMWWGSHLWPVWGQLLYSVRTGKSARKLLLETDGFAHLERDSATAKLFHRAAGELSRLAAAGVIRVYDFSKFTTIVDVGGGCGELLACILLAAPASRGVLFDRPHAIPSAKERFGELGLSSRCEFVTGDFFDSIPAGGDLYILKSIIHDWNDESGRKILENCRCAANGGRLLLVEQMLPSRVTNSPAHQAAVCSDLTMLAALAARERTEVELRTLLNATGLCVTGVIPAELGFTLIEAMAECDADESTPQDGP